MSSPRLTQGFRYDYSRQYTSNGTTTNYGMGKGLELIIAKDFELQVGVPAYIDKQFRFNSLSGLADETVLGRYRFMSANEESGNYIVSGSLGISIPTGSSQLSSHEKIYSPTLAAGKGWGTRHSGFSTQTSLSASVPDNNLSKIGEPVVWSTAFQAHITQHVWPEIETSYTHWHSGPYDGKNQLMLTYGIVLGRFDIKDRKNLTIGLGYQEPIGTTFSTFAREWIAMAKLSF